MGRTFLHNGSLGRGMNFPLVKERKTFVNAIDMCLYLHGRYVLMGWNCTIQRQVMMIY